MLKPVQVYRNNEIFGSPDYCVQWLLNDTGGAFWVLSLHNIRGIEIDAYNRRDGFSYKPATWEEGAAKVTGPRGQTFNEWLNKYEPYGMPADWEFAEHVVREAFPKALAIIRELAERCGWADAEEAAEKIINEAKP